MNSSSSKLPTAVKRPFRRKGYTQLVHVAPPVLPNERWLPVPGFEGYVVSSLGRVFSLARRMKYKTSKHKVLTARLLKQFLNIKSYASVSLRRDTKLHTLTVHTLVAWAFLGPQPLAKWIDHIDGDVTNNTPSNLRYVSPSINALNRKGCVGVSRTTNRKKWRALLCVKGEVRWLGSYVDRATAICAYQQAKAAELACGVTVESAPPP